MLEPFEPEEDRGQRAADVVSQHGDDVRVELVGPSQLGVDVRQLACRCVGLGDVLQRAAHPNHAAVGSHHRPAGAHDLALASVDGHDAVGAGVGLAGLHGALDVRQDAIPVVRVDVDDAHGKRPGRVVVGVNPDDLVEVAAPGDVARLDLQLPAADPGDRLGLVHGPLRLDARGHVGDQDEEPAHLAVGDVRNVGGLGVVGATVLVDEGAVEELFLARKRPVMKGRFRA